MHSISEVHAALGYTDADADALKKVRLVWQKLETLKAKAAKGETQAIRSYHDLLAKSLVPARAGQAVEDPETEARSFWGCYLDLCMQLGVFDLEQRRGAPHQHWCEKWLNAEYKAFAEALERVMEMPSKANFTEAQAAAEKMLKAYVEAFTKD